MWDIKSLNWLAIANVKSYNGLAKASVKSVNGLTVPTWAYPNFSGTAVAMDGSTEYWYDTTDEQLSITDDWTISHWIDPTDLLATKKPTQISENTSYGNTYGITYLLLTSGLMRVIIFTSSSAKIKDYTSSVTITAWARNHWVTTWDGTDMKFYLNGTEDTSITKDDDNTGAQIDDTRVWGMGARADGNAPFKGNFMSMNIHNTAISWANVTSHYDSGNGYLLDLRWQDGSGNLVHQRVPWQDSWDLWHDYVDSWGLDLSMANLTSDDRTAF